MDSIRLETVKSAILMGTSGIMSKIQVEFKGGQLLPITKYDAQRMEDFKDGSFFNLTSTGKRSNPHHNLYWGVLRDVCKTTQRWPTEHHLHSELQYTIINRNGASYMGLIILIQSKIRRYKGLALALDGNKPF